MPISLLYKSLNRYLMSSLYEKYIIDTQLKIKLNVYTYYGKSNAQSTERKGNEPFF